jgi:DNA-binding transcriptional MerR regulator
MIHVLEKERGRTYVGLPEFAETAERIIASLKFEQERGTVTAIPDERTIRYYLAEGLIQPPEEKRGAASVFSYLNLLQLVAVKKLQAEHLPISKIRELVPGKSEQELETLLGIGRTFGKKIQKSEAKQYLESLLAASTSKTLASAPPSMVMQKASSSGPTDFEQAQMAVLSSQTPDEPQSWQRVEIEPGLELHIRSDFSVPTTSAGLRSVAERIRRAVKLYWQRAKR